MISAFSFQTVCEPEWLEVCFERSHNVLSWAVVGGGWEKTNHVIWHRVRNEDLTLEIDPEEYFLNKWNARKQTGNVVGLLTSASLENYSETILQENECSIRTLVTVGLGNAVCIGDRPYRSPTYGTINILVQSSIPMNLKASIEAVSLIAEARSLAVLEAKIPSNTSKKFSTGTGTDCIAFASPDFSPIASYTGKHTLSGHLIGKSVYDSVSQGIENWKNAKRKMGDFL
ncbi:adenosylcobinamide amidohydrolase [Leptospira tipperaryensis]|uniref:Adenosylcobinamide amidohydrolase n=1 Tax=Leptospira tipperaryensis TaxID=2564040 RepID=A0A1D7V3V8_9LEPT|nr:adenosylcobinamide amidohydrolase [Leptospira tipperaryensis]AOP36537.1 adenosylcobinamide amidohydrolase [Leptospira tipperaryensis]